MGLGWGTNELSHCGMRGIRVRELQFIVKEMHHKTCRMVKRDEGRGLWMLKGLSGQCMTREVMDGERTKERHGR